MNKTSINYQYQMLMIYLNDQYDKTIESCKIFDNT